MPNVTPKTYGIRPGGRSADGFGAVILGVVACSFMAHISGALAAVAAVGAVAGGIAWCWRRRRAVSIGPEGLAELYYLGRASRCPWAMVKGVTFAEQLARIDTVYGPIVVQEPLQDWWELAREVEQVLGQEPVEDETVPPVPPEEVADWLDIGLTERLTVRGLYPWPALLPFASGAMLSLMLLLTGAVAPLSAGALCLLGGVLGTAGGARWAHRTWRDGDLRVTPEELRIRRKGLVGLLRPGWDSVGWHELRHLVETAVSPEDQSKRTVWRVLTDHGSFELWPDQVDPRILDAIRRSIAAREAGRALPRSIDVPDSAISRATDSPAEILVERGLSRPDD